VEDVIHRLFDGEGTGDIVLDGVVIEGNISITGSGDVVVSNCTVKGTVSVLGTGQLVDKGGNTFD